MRAWRLADSAHVGDERRPVASAGPNAQISGAGGGHTLSYQRLGAVLLGGVADISGSLVTLHDNLTRNIAYGVVADAPHVADLVTRRLSSRRRIAA